MKFLQSLARFFSAHFVSYQDFKDGFARGFAKVPVFGHLVYCTRANHADSIKEFVPSIAFSTATFWLTAIFLLALKVNQDATFLGLIRATTESGELLIFSLAFLGSIIVQAAEDPEKARTFPGRSWHFFVVFSVAVVAAGFYALIKVSASTGTRYLFNEQYVLTASAWVATAAIVLAYLTLLYRKQTFDADEFIKKPENEFVDEFARSVQ